MDDANLDTLCTFVYCTSDDLLPEARPNAKRQTTDAEIITLAVAQAIMGEPSDRRFLRRARRSLSHLFPCIPEQPGYFKRRRHLAPYLGWLLVIFAEQSPGSTTIFCSSTRHRSSVEEAGRQPSVRPLPMSATTVTARLTPATSGACVCTPSSPPTALPGPSSSPRPRRMSGRWEWTFLACCRREGGEILLGDKGYVGRDFAREVAELGATVVRRSERMSPETVLILLPSPAYRVDLLHLQGCPHPGTSPCSYLGWPQRAHLAALSLPGRLHQPQLPTGSSQPGLGRLLRVVAWNQSSRGGGRQRRPSG